MTLPTSFPGGVGHSRCKAPPVSVHNAHIQQAANFMDFVFVGGENGGADPIDGGIDLLHCCLLGSYFLDKTDGHGVNFIPVLDARDPFHLVHDRVHI